MLGDADDSTLSSPSGRNDGDLPKAHVSIVAKICCPFIILLGLVAIYGGYLVGGGYFGRSDEITGEVVEVVGSRPIVQYTVDGTTYQHATTEHGPHITVGQDIRLCYNPKNPSQAETCSARWAMVVCSGLGGVALVVALLLAGGYLYRYLRETAVIKKQYVVFARITGSRPKPNIHIKRKILWRVECAWADPSTGQDYVFTSPAFWSGTDPFQLLSVEQRASQGVYIDPARPGKYYYVDFDPVRIAGC